jgi:hypothetical protein
MHAGTFGIVITALLVIPTCLGLWRDDQNIKLASMKALLDRRKAERRMGRRPLHDPRANYHYLGPVRPAKSPSSLNQNYDRRATDRRVEDTAYQSEPLLPGHSDVRVFAPAIRQTALKVDIPPLEATRFHVGHTKTARFSGGSDPA